MLKAWPEKAKSAFLAYKAGGLSSAESARQVFLDGLVDSPIPESTYRNWPKMAEREKVLAAKIAALKLDTGTVSAVNYSPEIGPKQTTSTNQTTRSRKGPVVFDLKGSKPRILIFDIETLPNRGYFFDIYSDRGIPLQFVDKAKCVCTIAYKWYGEKESHVLVAKTPYDDKQILADFLEVYKTAHYVVGHYGDGFDIPFTAGRLAANGLGGLPSVASIDTYKLAKKHFGKTLNSNKLDHLGEIFGVGNKNKTDANLWVRCANNDPEALKEMALYNLQDVELLEKVLVAMRPYVKTKINWNLFDDSPVRRCKPCGSDDLDMAGYELTAATMRDRLRCNACGSYSSFPVVKL